MGGDRKKKKNKKQKLTFAKSKFQTLYGDREGPGSYWVLHL